MWDEGCSWLCDVVVKVLCLYPKGLLGSNPGRGDSCTAFQWMVCSLLDAYCTKNGSFNIIGWFTRSQAGTVSASEDEVTGFATLLCKWHHMFEKLVLSAQQKV